MLYGSDYQTAEGIDRQRRLRRYRRDIMFAHAQLVEVAAAGCIAGLLVAPLLVTASLIVGTLFAVVFGGTFRLSTVAAAAGLGLQARPTSLRDLLLVAVVVVATLGLAGTLTAVLRRYDYRRQGGPTYFLHHPRSALAMAGFFAPITALVVVGLLRLFAAQPRLVHQSADSVALGFFDRGVIYCFLGITLSMLLYLVWELCFPAILPTLSEFDVDAQVRRLEQEDLERIRAEEDRRRGFERRDRPD